MVVLIDSFRFCMLFGWLYPILASLALLTPSLALPVSRLAQTVLFVLLLSQWHFSIICWLYCKRRPSLYLIRHFVQTKATTIMRPCALLLQCWSSFYCRGSCRAAAASATGTPFFFLSFSQIASNCAVCFCSLLAFIIVPL